MSVLVSNRVWQQSNTKGSNRLTLLAIADNAHDDGTAYPGINGALTHKTKLTTRALGYIIDALAVLDRELAVYPQPGSSHDYIVLTAMSMHELRIAVKTVMSRRKLSAKELHRLRKEFATEAFQRIKKREDARKEGAKRVRTTSEPGFAPPPKTVPLEPSVTINEPSEGSNEPMKAIDRGLVFETVLKGSFNITYTKGAKLPKETTGRVNRIVKEVVEAGIDHEELAQAYTAWKREHPNLTSLQSGGKIVLDILGRRGSVPAKQVSPEDTARTAAEQQAEHERAKHERAEAHARWEALSEEEKAEHKRKVKYNTNWETAYGQLQLQMPRETFDTWLRSARLITVDQETNTYVLGVANPYAKEWLEHRLDKVISRTLSQIAGTPSKVKYVLWAEHHAAEEAYEAEPDYFGDISHQLAKPGKDDDGFGDVQLKSEFIPDAEKKSA